MAKKAGKASEMATEEDVLALQNPEIIPLKIRLIVRVLWNSGLRAGELLQAKRNNLVRKNYGYFLILETQKSGVLNEPTPLTQEDYFALVEYCDYHNKRPSDFILTGERGRHKVQWLNRELKKYCKKVGITINLTSHSFRKGRIVSLRENDVPYAEIAEITRHKNLKVMSDHYNPKKKAHAYKLTEKYKFTTAKINKEVTNNG